MDVNYFYSWLDKRNGISGIEHIHIHAKEKSGKKIRNVLEFSQRKTQANKATCRIVVGKEKGNFKI